MPVEVVNYFTSAWRVTLHTQFASGDQVWDTGGV